MFVFNPLDFTDASQGLMIHFLFSGIQSADSVARSYRNEHDSDGQPRAMVLNVSLKYLEEMKWWSGIHILCHFSRFSFDVELHLFSR
jgi:hypothetical protein